jgi:hypothetical protein
MKQHAVNQDKTAPKYEPAKMDWHPTRRGIPLNSWGLTNTQPGWYEEPSEKYEAYLEADYLAGKPNRCSTIIPASFPPPTTWTPTDLQGIWKRRARRIGTTVPKQPPPSQQPTTQLQGVWRMMSLNQAAKNPQQNVSFFSLIELQQQPQHPQETKSAQVILPKATKMLPEHDTYILPD